MTFDVSRCLYVVSFPRSGTHLLIDFIRRNFPQFNRALAPWDSAAKLYVNLDGLDWRGRASYLLQGGRTDILLKSHFAGYTSRVDVEAKSLLHPRQEMFFYPFRKFSSVVKSYAELVGWNGPISAILSTTDCHYNNGASVADCIRGHASGWLERDAHFVDSDRLGQTVELGAAQIGRLIDLSPAARARRLPHRKIAPGKFGEFVERITGRESTEVVIKPRLFWRDAEEQSDVDRQFEDLYLELSKRRIN